MITIMAKLFRHRAKVSKPQPTIKPRPIKPAIAVPVHSVMVRRGRGTPYPVNLVGEPLKDGEGNVFDVTTVPLSTFPGTVLDDYAVQQGFNLSRVKAEGINALSLELAAGNNPVFEQQVLQAGLADNPESARITALHLRKLAQRIGVSPEQVLGTLAVEYAQDGPLTADPAEAEPQTD